MTAVLVPFVITLIVSRDVTFANYDNVDVLHEHESSCFLALWRLLIDIDIGPLVEALLCVAARVLRGMKLLYSLLWGSVINLFAMGITN